MWVLLSVEVQNSGEDGGQKRPKGQKSLGVKKVGGKKTETKKPNEKYT